MTFRLTSGGRFLQGHHTPGHQRGDNLILCPSILEKLASDGRM